MCMNEIFYFAKCMCVSGLLSPHHLVISNLGTELGSRNMVWGLLDGISALDVFPVLRKGVHTWSCHLWERLSVKYPLLQD